MQTRAMVTLAALVGVSVIHGSTGAAGEARSASALGTERPNKPKWSVYRDWPFDSKKAKWRQEQTAKELGLPVELANSIGMKLVLVPAGEFRMGSEKGSAHVSQRPVRRVRITKPFYLGTHEVTQAQYEAIMQQNPSRFNGKDNNPVDQVKWKDAVEFCRRLSEKDERNYRLPTEAEWEYACRAGSAGRYHFGDDTSRLKKYAWYSDKSGSGPHSVGQLKPNAWGLYDMHGNVWEWCKDRYGAYSGRPEPDNDPQGPDSDKEHVIRGGGWNNCFATSCGSATRSWLGPENTFSNEGFRIVCTVKP